jgi:hypothetical protein
MLRLNRWVGPQPFVPNPFDLAAPKVDQDIKQVWFAGSDSDVGGAYRFPNTRRCAHSIHLGREARAFEC